MKIILLIFAITLINTFAHAACPTGWEEIPMEKIEATTTSCPSGTQSYYQASDNCDSGIL